MLCSVLDTCKRIRGTLAHIYSKDVDLEEHSINTRRHFSQIP